MPLFDPATGKVLDPDALRSVQVRASGFRRARSRVVEGKKVTEHPHEDDGGLGAVTTEHGSGRQDVNVFTRAPQVGAVGGS